MVAVGPSTVTALLGAQSHTPTIAQSSAIVTRATVSHITHARLAPIRLPMCALHALQVAQGFDLNLLVRAGVHYVPLHLRNKRMIELAEQVWALRVRFLCGPPAPIHELRNKRNARG